MKPIANFNKKNKIYDEHLKSFRNVYFTIREIDIMSCFIHNRTGQNIASFLSIASRTASAHIYNIRTKLGYIPKNKIVDWVEESGKLQYLKHYYIQLVYERLFNKYLDKIKKLIKNNQIKYSIDYKDLSENQINTLEIIKYYLAFSNISIEALNDDKEGEVRKKIQIINKNISQNSHDHIVNIVLNKFEGSNSEKLNGCIYFTENENHYLSLLLLIEKLADNNDITDIIILFKESCEKLQSSFAEESNASKKPIQKAIDKKFYLLLISFIIIVPFSIFVYQKKDNTTFESNTKTATFNIPLLLEHYINRKEITNVIWDKFREKDVNKKSIKLIGLYGLGGVGKTMLAKHCVNEPENQYNFIGWFNAEAQGLLESQYIDFGEKYSLFSKGISLKNKIETVKDWLEGYEKILLVFDNVIDVNILKNFLPKKGHVIITSGNKNIPNALEVEEMTHEEALQFFNKIFTAKVRNNTNYKSSVKALALELGNFPLAMSHAAAYISTNLLTIEQYIDLYKNQKTALLRDNTLLPMEDHLPVYISWDLNINKLKQQKSGDRAIEILNFITCLNKENIPIDLVSEFLYGKGFKEHHIEFNNLFSLLEKYSLIKKTSANTFSVHKLVHSWLSSTLSKERKTQIIKKVILSIENIYPKRRITNEDRNFLVQLLPHIISTLDGAKLNLQENEYINLFYILGRIYYILGDYEKSLRFFQQGLKINEQYFKLDNQERFRFLDHIGKACTQLGKYDAAAEALKKSLSMKQKYYNLNHVDIAHTQQHLARVYLYKGVYHKAQMLFEKSLLTQKHFYTPRAVEVAHILDNIGVLYLFTEKRDKAQEVLEESLSIKKSHYGNTHVETARTMGSLGSVYLDLHDFLKAKVLLQGALDIQVKNYGKNSGIVAYIKSYLGTAYLYLNEFQQAFEHLNDALLVRKKLYGDNHIETGYTVHNLALFYLYIGQYQKAEKFLEESLLIKKKHLGTEDHIEMAITYDALALIKIFLGKFSEASKLVESSYDIAMNVYSNNDINKLEVIIDHGNMQRLLGNYKKSEEILCHALIVAQELHKLDHLNIGIIKANLGLLYHDLGDNTKKEFYLRGALEIFTTHLSISHPYILKTNRFLKGREPKKNKPEIGFFARILIA